jgi:mRNA interferase RelE/StbE
MSYTILIERQAQKVIKTLDKQTVQRIHERIKELSVTPYNHRISGVVTMEKGRHKFRVGDWRIIFKIDEKDKAIFIVAVRPRRRAYPKQ